MVLSQPQKAKILTPTAKQIIMADSVIVRTDTDNIETYWKQLDIINES